MKLPLRLCHTVVKHNLCCRHSVSEWPLHRYPSRLRWVLLPLRSRVIRSLHPTTWLGRRGESHLVLGWIVRNASRVKPISPILTTNEGIGLGTGVAFFVMHAGAAYSLHRLLYDPSLLIHCSVDRAICKFCRARRYEVVMHLPSDNFTCRALVYLLVLYISHIRCILHVPCIL